MSKYYVIECHDNSGVKNTQVEGPFPSVAAAKRYIREGCEDLDVQKEGLHEGRNTDWGMNHIIVEEVGVVKPVPVVKVEVQLSKVEGGHPDEDDEEEEDDDDAITCCERSW